MFRHLHCEAHRTRSAVEVQHEGNITRSASSIRSFTQIRQESSSIFNAKPTGPAPPLTFSLALPPQAISPAALHHASSIRSFTQIRQECSSINAKPSGFVHGSSPQAISPAALHPSEASPKSDKNAQAFSKRSPPDQIAR